MSLALVYTRAALGLHAPLVTVEVHVSNGLPALTIVGLPEAAVRESETAGEILPASQTGEEKLIGRAAEADRHFP